MISYNDGNVNTELMHHKLIMTMKIQTNNDIKSDHIHLMEYKGTEIPCQIQIQKSSSRFHVIFHEKF